MDIGIRLTKFREAKNISKNKLAQEVGVTQGFISQVELGNRLPTLEVLNRICVALGITPADFFADQPLELSPEIRQIVGKLQKLPPDKLQILESVLDSWAEDDDPRRMKGKHDLKAPRIIRGVRTSKKSPPPWYVEEIKKGRPLNDAGFLCRLLDENIISPTIYGRTLTQEQKEGLIRFIESRKDLLSDFKKDDTSFPEKHGARDEGKELLDLKKEPELTSLMGASDIISEMLHRYLKEEGKTD